jgi:hypothetical protein
MKNRCAWWTRFISNVGKITREGSAIWFSQKVTVHILCSTSGATIYYTLDGSTPTTSSSVYPSGDGILLSGAGTKTVKAIGVKTGLSNSAIATATF